ncbi:VOC family protein [Streptomyces sp. NPDC126503]|uniref:VOC family protein n=1 Tax=Streptomyces sp. NPDC126503 TaxID=3155315 RepID=UPI0033206807
MRIGDTGLGARAPGRPRGPGAPWIVLSIGVDDIAETLGRVRARGGTVSGEPRDMPWGSASPTSGTPTAIR